MPSALPAATVFGRRLRNAREANGWTQAELAEYLFGVEDPNTGAPRISRWERGMHKPDVETLEALADLLGLPAAYFLASSDTVAEAIVVISALGPRKQKKALALLKELAKKPKRR